MAKSLRKSLALSFLMLALQLSSLLAAVTAPQAIALGRASLATQTPLGLQQALAHFNNAVSLEPNNLEANLLKAATLVVLEQGTPQFQQQLTGIGVAIINPDIYFFEYQLPVDAEGITRPIAGVNSDSTLSYVNSRVSLLDEALACLAKFTTAATTKSFRTSLSAAETSLADIRVDYGDVLILRALLKTAKAGIALANSYDFSGEYALLYRLFKAGDLTPQRVLTELPDLLKFADSAQRAAVVSGMVSANADYQAAYAFIKSTRRLPAAGTPYLFEFADQEAADLFATELKNLVGSLSMGTDAYLYQSFYPFFLQGLTINPYALLSSSTPLRSYLTTSFNQGFPVRSSWPDESFGGALPEPYGAGVLLDELDLWMGQLVDSDGDGLSDSWERGYGRYEVVHGHFISDWAASDAAWQDGHLATFTSQAEWDWFWRRYWREVDQPLYLGLESSTAQPQVWNWTTGEQGAFYNWAPGEPDAANTTAVMDASLKWRSLRKYVGYLWNPVTWQSYSDFPSEDIGYVFERGYPTDPNKWDTDGDGFNDQAESKIGTDPNNRGVFPTGDDLDKDGVNNSREAADRTDPLDPDSFNPLSIGLVAYYPFSGNAADESGYGRTSSATSVVKTNDRFGLPDRAYEFNGTTSFVDTGFAPGSAGPRTFSCWVKVGSRSNFLSSLVSQPKTTQTTLLRLGLQKNNALDAYSTAVYSPSGETIVQPRSAADGLWHQAVVVADGWVLYFYVDGQLVGASYYGQTASSQASVLIGKEFQVGPAGDQFGAHYFKGFLDDVRIYDRALSYQEVGDLFSAESYFLQDTDADGLPDYVETNTGRYLSPDNTGTDPNKPDTDGDGLGDRAETGTGLFIDRSNSGTDPNKADSNGDGISDGEAVVAGLDPLANYAVVGSLIARLSDQQPGRFNLYTLHSIMDMHLGGLMLQKTGSSVVVKVQMQTTTDLVTQPFTNNGTPVSLPAVSMPGSKGFLRIKAGP